MLPVNTIYPEFVPDQLLTSEDLNNLFGYLDEQGRMTRTNLIGIGIVCGLEIITPSNGSSLTITKGCGVTSEGYLISVPEITYTEFKAYDPVKPIYYDRLVNISSKTKKFDLWELKQSGEETGTTNLSSGFLNDKAVLLFVELLEEENKNCDPNSCDDKGKKVTVTIRPLLVPKTDAASLIAVTGGSVTSHAFNELAEIKMQRFDVPNTFPVQTADIFNAYQKILSTTFISNLNTILTGAYTIFLPVIEIEYPSDPFAGMAASFAFLNDGSITQNNLIHIQYYYDLFSDFLKAYEEFRQTGTTILSTCCPDNSLFPRHLLLGEAIPLTDTQLSSYRHYFIYSPLFDRKDLLKELKSLFKRLVLMKNNFFIPPVNTGTGNTDTFIRITPSRLDYSALSNKALPYYYHANTGTFPLYKYWSYEKTKIGKADTNLSYNASDYTSKDEIVNPLKYDLESFNFLSVEGIIGKPYTDVLQSIQGQIANSRLPFDVIALRTGNVDFSAVDFTKSACIINDLEISYDVSRREYEAVIGLSIEWLNDHRTRAALLVNTGNNNRLQNFIDKMLQPIKGYLVNDLPQFITNYNSFIVLYEHIETEAVSIRDLLITKQGVPTQTPDQNFLEDLIDHFDAIIMSAKKGPFRALHQAFMERFNEIYGARFFSYFTAKCPGIQHKAGVPMGGTFIIVYHETDKLTDNTIKPSRRTTREAGTSPFKKALSEKGKLSDTTNASKDISNFLDEMIFLKNSGADNAVLEEKMKGFLGRSETATAEALPPDIVSTIEEGTVIADFYLPYLCCSECPPIQYIVQEIPPPLNEPPVARAGEDITITLPQDTVTLDGTSSSDPDGTIKTYEWRQASGPSAANIKNPSDAVTDVTSLLAGTYIFELTVTDDQGATDVDTVTITVVEAENIPPVARAGEDVAITLPLDTVTLDGTSSTDPDGTIKTYAWTQTSGPSASSIAKPNEAITDVTGLQAGTYFFELTVTDDRGAIGVDTVTITVVEAENVPPVANAGDDITITAPNNKVTLNGENSTDPDGTITAFSWKQTSGPIQATIGDPNAKVTDVSGLQPGTYIFELTVTDNRSATATDTATVVVNPFVKTCFPLIKIISAFNSLESVDAQNFGQFTQGFQQFEQIKNFFAQLSTVAASSTAEQINFFATSGIREMLIGWLNNLRTIILEFTRFRLLAVALFSILVQLTFYISCLQPEDVNKAKVPMDDVLKIVIDVLNSVRQVVASFTGSEKDVLRKLLEIAKAELDGVNANNEAGTKLIYMAMLKQIIEIIESMHL